MNFYCHKAAFYWLFLPAIVMLTLEGCHHKSSEPPGIPAVEDHPILKDSVAFRDSSFLQLINNHSVSITDVMSQRWEMVDADQAYWNQIFWDSSEDKRKFPGISLYNDFSATENARTKIRLGTWKVDRARSLLLLHFQDGSHIEYLIHELSATHMDAYLKKEDDFILVKFSSDGRVRKKPSDDPFYPSNNQWRIRPVQPESTELIRGAHKKLYSLFLAVLSRQLFKTGNDCCLWRLPCCFNWFNGAIELQDMIELDQRWINCFYSKEQAWKGYDMIRNALNTKTLNWPKHKTWVYQTGNVLQQLYDQL